MVVTLDIPGKIAGMTVNRDKNFTDKEATLLHLVAPQIALAHRNAHEFTALKRAAAQTIPTPEELRQTGVTARESEVLPLGDPRQARPAKLRRSSLRARERSTIIFEVSYESSRPKHELRPL